MKQFDSCHFFLLNKPKISCNKRKLISSSHTSGLNNNNSDGKSSSPKVVNTQTSSLKDPILFSPNINDIDENFLMDESNIISGLNASQSIKLDRSEKDKIDYSKVNLTSNLSWYLLLDKKCADIMFNSSLTPDEIDIISTISLQKMISNFPILEEKRILKLVEYLKNSRKEKSNFMSTVPKSISCKSIFEYLEKLQIFIEKENIIGQEWIKILKTGLTNEQLEKLKENNINLVGKKFSEVKDLIRKTLDKKPASFYKAKLYNFCPQRFKDISISDFCKEYYETFKAADIEESIAIDVFYYRLPSNLRVELNRFDRNIDETKKYENLKDLMNVVKNLPIIRNPSNFMIYKKKKILNGIRKKTYNEKTFKCYICNKTGHLANNCPNKKKNNVQNKNKKVYLINGFNFDKSPPPKLIGLKINGEEGFILNGLVDSGSSNSYISEKILSKLNKNNFIDLNENTIVKTVGGELKVKLVKLKISRIFDKNFQEIIVGVLNMDEEFIIGRDLMEIFKIIYFEASQSINIPEINNYDMETIKIEEKLENYDNLIKQIENEIKNNFNIKSNFSKLPFVKIRMKKEDRENESWTNQFPIPQIYKKLLEDKINYYKSKGIIEKIKDDNYENRFNSPLFCVPKADKINIREVEDFRAVNKLILDEPTSIPKMDDIIDKLSGNSVFSELDLKDAYHQLEILPEDRFITAFTFNNIRYQWRGVPFGIKTIPAIFQRSIKTIFEPISNVINFFDNIIIFTKNEQNHIDTLKTVFSKLNELNLKINEKSRFFMKKIKILGCIFNSDGIRPDKEKLIKLYGDDRPNTGKKIRRFLGLVNFFRRWIPHYSTLFHPFEVVRYTKTFKWNEDFEKRYKNCLDILSNPPILYFVDFESPLFLACDASNYGIGGCIFQIKNIKVFETINNLDIFKDYNNFKLISFNARALTACEQRYSTPKKELLSIVYNLHYYSEWLTGRKFHLLSDNRPLTFLLKFLNNGKQSQFLLNWLWEIQQFNFDVTFIDGIKNILPDRLSRLIINWDNNNKSDNKVLLLEQKLDLKNIVSEAHKMGHFGIVYLFNYIKFVLGVPDKDGDLFKLCNLEIKNCLICGKYNEGRIGFHPMKSIFAEYPMKHIAFDVLSMGNNHTEEGSVAILILIDAFTRFVWLYSLKDKTAKSVAECIINLVTNFGIMEELQSDNDQVNRGEVLKEILKILNIKHQFVAAYNPRSNGIVERQCKVVLSSIIKMCNEIFGNVNTWDIMLPSVQMAINSKVNTLTNSTPFSLMFGRQAINNLKNMEKEKLINNNIDMENMFIKQWELINKIIYPEIIDKIKKKQLKSQKRANSKRKIVKFNLNDYVFLIRINRNDKCISKWIGPFKIGRISRGGTYSLYGKENELLFDTIPPSQLKLWEGERKEELLVTSKILEENPEFIDELEGVDSNWVTSNNKKKSLSETELFKSKNHTRNLRSNNKSTRVDYSKMNSGK